MQNSKKGMVAGYELQAMINMLHALLGETPLGETITFPTDTPSAVATPGSLSSASGKNKGIHSESACWSLDGCI